MIKGINSSSKHLSIHGGSISGPYFNSFAGQTMVGQLRYNPSSTNIEVYDGNAWVMLPSAFPSIVINQDAEKAIDWAIRKQQEEVTLQDLLGKHPGLKEAYERLEIMKALCLEEEKISK